MRGVSSCVTVSVADANCHEETEDDSHGISHMLEVTMIGVQTCLLNEGEVQEEGIEYL